MKNDMKTTAIRIFVCAAFLSSVVSCSFFDMMAPQKIQADEWFYNENSLRIYANGFLNEYTPDYGTICWGDEDAADCIARTLTSSFYTGSWSPNDQGGWASSSWKALYNINYFLVHLRETPGVSEEVLDHYEGVGRFWRAWFYFSKVKTFGAVPWYDEPIDSDDMESLYKDRDSREYVMHRILEDLNYASEHCLTSGAYVNNGQINGYIASLFKSRVCLFEGTYRKYHKVEPSFQKPWSTEYESADDFLREAEKACTFIMDSGQYTIVNTPANVRTQYRALFNSGSVDYREVLWAREYIDGTIMSPVTWYFNSSTSGHCWSMTKKFLNTYLHLDGSRHTDKPGYERLSYVDELSEDRDARLAQTIITPTYTKLQSGKPGPAVPNFLIARTGYQVIKWSIDNDALESTSLSYNCLPIMRYAEVLLNYAEARAELGLFNENDWNRTIAVLRSRAGVSAKMPETEDPYLVSYFKNTVDDMYLLEIRRERGIELFMEGRRFDDLCRWHLGELIEDTWEGMYLPEGQPQDLLADGSKKVCLVEVKTSEQPDTQYLDMSTNQYIGLNENNCLVFEMARRIWTEKMYLRPIPVNAIEVNNNLTQNVLWQ